MRACSCRLACRLVSARGSARVGSRGSARVGSCLLLCRPEALGGDDERRRRRGGGGRAAGGRAATGEQADAARVEGLSEMARRVRIGPLHHSTITDSLLLRLRRARKWMRHQVSRARRMTVRRLRSSVVTGGAPDARTSSSLTTRAARAQSMTARQQVLHRRRGSMEAIPDARNSSSSPPARSRARRDRTSRASSASRCGSRGRRSRVRTASLNETIPLR